MRSFDELLKESSTIHGHLCAGQVLGVRMAMVGCREVEIDEPKGCKKLLVYVEIDRCATDAIQAVTGCSLGKRTLKFLDYGKMAATFINLETQRAIRIAAKEEARTLASSYVSSNSGKHEAGKKAYLSMPDESLFSIQPVKIQIPGDDLPGARSGRVFCEQCGEGINFKRQVERNGQIYCIPCARGSYLLPKGKADAALPRPNALLVIGAKKAGKTTLIENLIPELTSRGYRVGTIKHHHSSSPMNVDCEGKDSWRHRRAGARATALVSPAEIALFQSAHEAISLDELIGRLKGVDIVLVEGFRSEPRPRIEVRKTPERGPSSSREDDHLIAVVCPEEGDGGSRRFRPEDIRRLADLIERKIFRRPRQASHALP